MSESEPPALLVDDRDKRAPGDLTGRRAVVVGAGQAAGRSLGIGRAIAVVLADRGAELVLVDCDIAGATETADLLERRGHPVGGVVRADVTERADCWALRETVGALGGLDVLVNSVGILGDGTALTTGEDVWARTLDVNLTAMWRVIHELLPLMVEARQGAIVNVSSIGANGGPNLAYGISKAGVNRLTLAVAAEAAPYDVRCNAVLPGLIDTPMAVEGHLIEGGPTRQELVARRDALVPMAYKGTAFDVARTVAFLASDEARFVSGALVPVDGALVASSW